MLINHRFSQETFQDPGLEVGERPMYLLIIGAGSRCTDFTAGCRTWGCSSLGKFERASCIWHLDLQAPETLGGFVFEFYTMPVYPPDHCEGIALGNVGERAEGGAAH